MEIPAPRADRTAGTRPGNRSREREARRKRKRGHGGKTPWQKPKDVMRTEKEVGKTVEWLPRKAAMALSGPVPETDTGGWGENPKAGGRSIVKELGKMAP